MLGLQATAAVVFGLVFAVIVRTDARWRVVPLFFRMLTHWFYFGWHDRLPPWLFQSPCGSWGRRQFLALLAVGLLAVPLTSMAAHSFTGLVEPTPARAVPIPVAQSRPNDTTAARALSFVRDDISIHSWLWLAPTALICLTIPPITFCLIGILLTGNIIMAYHHAFEVSSGTPQPPTFPSVDQSDPMATGEGGHS
jgi:hypothetical protein